MAVPKVRLKARPPFPHSHWPGPPYTIQAWGWVPLLSHALWRKRTNLECVISQISLPPFPKPYGVGI